MFILSLSHSCIVEAVWFLFCSHSQLGSHHGSEGTLDGDHRVVLQSFGSKDDMNISALRGGSEGPEGGHCGLGMVCPLKGEYAGIPSVVRCRRGAETFKR